MNRLLHIDCARALAAVLVMLIHLAERVPDRESSFILNTLVTLQHYIDLGAIGVFLFFIVSGYVVSESIIVHQGDNIKKFVISRFFRLYPAYWLALLLGVIEFGNAHSVYVYLTNITMTQQFISISHVYWLFWTLTVELVFYFCCIVFYKLKIIQNLNLLCYIFVALTVFAAFSATIRYYFDIIVPFGWPMWISLFVGGAILRRIDVDQPQKWGRYCWMGGGYLLCILVVSFGIWHDPEVYQRSWHQGFFSLAISVSLFVAINYLWRIQSSIGAYLGRISYSIYLLHMPVGSLYFFLAAQFGELHDLPPVLVLCLMVSMTILASAASFRWIEKPAINAGKRASSWLVGSSQKVKIPEV